MIRCCVQGSNKNWDKFLPQLAAAVRAMPNRSTGFSANLMMLGREVFSPRDLLFKLVDENDNKEPPAYVQQLMDTLSKTHQIAREHLKVSQNRQKKTYDVKLAERSFEEGDLVYRLESASKPGQSRKLNKVWSGPYLVIKVLSRVLYRIKGRRKEFVTHHDRLKICNDRYIPMWMRRMRHSFLDLDTTIAYDQDEQEESLLEDVFRDLFSETGEPDPMVGATVDSQPAVTHSQSSDVVDSQVSILDSTVGSEEVVTSTPIPLTEPSIPASESLPPRRTRRGRAVCPPAYLNQYNLD